MPRTKAVPTRVLSGEGDVYVDRDVAQRERANMYDETKGKMSALVREGVQSLLGSAVGSPLRSPARAPALACTLAFALARTLGVALAVALAPLAQAQAVAEAQGEEALQGQVAAQAEE